MNWALVKSTLETVVRDGIPGLPDKDVDPRPGSEPRWVSSSKANAIARPKTGWKVLIDLIGDRQVSRRVEHYVNDNDELHERVRTISVATFQVTCECDFFDDNAERWAAMVVKRICERIRLTANREALLSANLALTTIGELVNLSRPHEGRMISAFSRDLFFSMGSEENTEEDEPDGLDYFDRVIITPEHIKNADGTIVPADTFTVEDTE